MTVQIPYALQNVAHPANVFRVANAAPFGGGGILAPGELAVSAQSTPNMSVAVSAGRAMIMGSNVSPPSGFSFTAQGGYTVLNDASVSVTIAAADATNPRIDVVYLQVQDAFYSGTLNQAVLAVAQGVPAATPTAPGIPPSALALANIAVAANASSIVAANISQVATRAGVITTTVATVAALPGSGNWVGRIIYVTGVGLYIWTGSAWLAQAYRTDYKTAVTDVSGNIVVTHGLGVTPRSVQITGGTTGTIPDRRTYGVAPSGITSTQFIVTTYRQDTGGVFTSNQVDFWWTVYA